MHFLSILFNNAIIKRVWRLFQELVHFNQAKEELKTQNRDLQRLKEIKKDFLTLRQQSNNNPRFKLDWKERFLCYNDKIAVTEFEPHYLYHTAWAARILAKLKNTKHIDISSELRFITLVSAFIPIEYYEFRPPELNLSGLTLKRADLSNLPFKSNSIESLSCMHVVEHIGLGRYGDPIDYEGDLKAIRELIRVLAVGGNFLIVVPIGGTAKILFNAHRIYTHKQILSYFRELKLLEFSLIPDNSEDIKLGIIRNPSEEIVERQHFGCGCYWFTK